MDGFGILLGFGTTTNDRLPQAPEWVGVVGGGVSGVLLLAGHGRVIVVVGGGGVLLIVTV